MIHIVLYQPEKPANTGNILRTAVALRAKVHLIGPLTFKVDDHSLKRAGMDYLTTADYEYYENLDAFNEKHPHVNGYYITRYANKSYVNADFSQPGGEFYLFFGSESKGLPHQLLRDNFARSYRIPMVPNARSLNLSNAVAIVAYEVARQQDFMGLAKAEAIKGRDFLKNESID